MPYKTSSKDFSLGLVDRDIVRRYRHWLVNHFTNDFQYEKNVIFPLGKVRDAINGAMILGKTNATEMEMKLREFDLLVRVDEITKDIPSSPSKEE